VRSSRPVICPGGMASWRWAHAGSAAHEKVGIRRSPIWVMHRPLTWVKLLHYLEGGAMSTPPDNSSEAADNMGKLMMVPEPRQ
jgi:hypothetical protein